MNPDMSKVVAFAGRVVSDIAATVSGVMTNIGHKLGLYKAMAGAGPLSSWQLADRTGLHERYLREWLNNQTAGGYVFYDAATGTYTLPDEHVPVLALVWSTTPLAIPWSVDGVGYLFGITGRMILGLMAGLFT